MVDQDMKGPGGFEETKKTSEREGRLARVKRLLTCQTRNNLTFDDAKASAKARKRKERQESLNSLSQERKVIRSNSEERPEKTEENDIRRVSSNEDFQKNNNFQDTTAIQAIQDGPVRIHPWGEILLDESEFEKRRSHERFLKPIIQKPRYNQGKKPRNKHFIKHQSKKIDDDTRGSDADSDSEICALLSSDRSPSPARTPISPVLDLTTLHQQIDNAEPLPSSRNFHSAQETLPALSVASNRLLSSPRNSVIITQRIYLNPDVPQNNSPKNPVEQRLKQLAKQINSLKKKIKRYDEDFEAKRGYKPSHADKLNDKNVKKICYDLTRLKREVKQLQDDPMSSTWAESKKPTVSLKDTIAEIEKRLDAKRKTSDRSSNVEDLTNEQMIEEKVAVQKALLYLESVHGRPVNKDEKNLARPLYDKYRLLKRGVARLVMVSNINELATIHEHETMDFVSLPTQVVESESEKLTLTGSTDSDTDTSIGENLHALSLEELIDHQKKTNEEKKQLRRNLKEFEMDFESKTGKKLQKEDRAPMESVYLQYKKAKAKLRLLDALVGKQTL